MFSAAHMLRATACCGGGTSVDVDNLDVEIPVKTLIPATRRSDCVDVLIPAQCDPETGAWTVNEGEAIPMSDYDINSPSDAGSKVFEGQVQDLILPVANTATAADAIKAAVALGPVLICKETGKSTPATADDACAYKVNRLPCETTWLKDPTDAGSGVTVGPDDGMWVGGVPVNATGDAPHAAIDPDRPVVGGADAIGVWCVDFSRKLTKAEQAAL